MLNRFTFQPFNPFNDFNRLKDDDEDENDDDPTSQMKITINNPAFRLVPPLFNTIELVEDFVMEHPLGVRTIPAGFICDLESVPQCFQWLFPKLGRGALAGIAHDDLYRSRLVTRAEADAIYLALLKQLGTGAPERWLKYLTLRLVGWIAWRQLGSKFKA